MRIRSHAPGVYLAMAAAGMVTLVFMGIYVYLMWADGRAGILLGVFVTPFVLVGSLLAFFGTRTFIRQAWFRRWSLEVPDGGCVLGQLATATLLPGRAVTATSELQCRLRCIRFTPRRGNAPSGANIVPLWSTSWTVPAIAIVPVRGLVLTLPFPTTGQPTMIDRTGGGNIVWQLNVQITSADGSDEPVFDVPVRG